MAAVACRQVVKHVARRVRAAEHGLGEAEERVGLLRAAGRVRLAPRGQVDHAAHRDRDRDEQHEGEQVARLGDRERVQRRGEEPVQQQAGADRGDHGGPEAADDRDRDDRDQVDQQVVGEVEVRLEYVEQHGKQRQPGHGEYRAGHLPAPGDPAVLVPVHALPV